MGKGGVAGRGGGEEDFQRGENILMPLAIRRGRFGPVEKEKGETNNRPGVFKEGEKDNGRLGGGCSGRSEKRVQQEGKERLGAAKIKWKNASASLKAVSLMLWE